MTDLKAPSAQPKIRLKPSAPDVGPEQGFEGTDLFGYATFGERLALLFERIETPFVGILDGQWGSGKTTFAKQWAGHLRKKGFPVIHFDAFENDFLDDAFLLLAAQVADLAAKKVGRSQAVTKSFLSGSKRIGKILLPVATKIAIKAATIGILSDEDFKSLSDSSKELTEKVGDDLASSVEKAIEDRLTQAESERRALDLFKQSLSEVAAALSEKALDKTPEEGFPKPLVFIIDELDRCRPIFALNLLERIKHLYTAHGVTFLLIANLKQLEASVHGTYGQNCDAAIYLEKFFDLRIVLPHEDTRGTKNRSKYISHLFEELGIRGDTGDDVQSGITEFSEIHNLSFRSIERIVSHVALTFASSTERNLRLAPLITVLCIIRHTSPSLYTRMLSGDARYSDVHAHMQFDQWSENRISDWYTGWIKFAMQEPLDEKLEQELRSSLFRYNAPQERLMRFTASYIDAFNISKSAS